jgi:hypothetical protein
MGLGENVLVKIYTITMPAHSYHANLAFAFYGEGLGYV